MKYSKDDIVGIECRHVVQANDRTEGSDDELLFIKEAIHLKDGRVIPNTRKVKNFKRDFYVTKQGFRNHKDKKLFESLDKVHRFTCTDRTLKVNVAKALNARMMDLRRMARSNYLYGTDVTAPVIAKRGYRDRWPTLVSLNTIAVCDLEADIVNGRGTVPIAGSLTFKDKALLVATREWAGTVPNLEQAVHEKFELYLGDYKRKRNIKLKFILVDTPGELVCELLSHAHQWQPDFLTFWNMNYDIPTMVNILKAEGIDPADVFSDPTIPPEYRFFEYIEGASTMVTANGKIKNLSFAERWHTAKCPASFYIIDAMCVYQKIRAGRGKESYALDDVLDKNLGVRKLNFNKADGLSKTEWHMLMQTTYKVEYLIYNLFDSISVELLDEKTMDLSSTISLLCKESEYSRFPSQPRRTCDRLHFFALQEEKHVIASTSDEMITELDSLVVSTADWVNEKTLFINLMYSLLNHRINYGTTERV